MKNNDQLPWGIALLILGLVFLLKKLGMFSPEIEAIIFTWKNILLALGIIFTFSKKNRSTGVVLISLWIFFYLKEMGIWTKHLANFIWPILLIIAGLIIVFNSRKR